MRGRWRQRKGPLVTAAHVVPDAALIHLWHGAQHVAGEVVVDLGGGLVSFVLGSAQLD